MNIVDIIIIAVILLFAGAGFFFGFVRTVGYLLCNVVGLYLAYRFYSPVGEWIIKVTGWDGNSAQFWAFVIGFILISIAVGLIGRLIIKLLDLVARLPFISLVNRFAGLAFGILQGVLICASILYVVARYPIATNVMTLIEQSKMVGLLNYVVVLISPFIPEGLKLMKSVIQNFK
ncbi:MAG: CvpA family protein [Patescibacteria group bacterium]